MTSYSRTARTRRPGASAAALRAHEHPDDARSGSRRGARLGQMLRLGAATVVVMAGLVAWGESRAQTPSTPVPTAQERAGLSVTERREAAAAAIEGKRGNLDDRGADYQSNALQRCARLPAEQRTDCESRVRGEGAASGSVQGGGIIRRSETTTISPAPQPPAGPGTPGVRELPPLPVPTPGANPTTPAPAVRGSGY